mgnify:CR=1 FL=1
MRATDPLMNEEVMARAFVLAIKEVMSDEETLKSFWESGYKHLSAHATKNAQQWVGKKILTWLLTSSLALVIAYFLLFRPPKG